MHAGPLLAQAANAQTSNSPIIVTGERQTRAQIRAEATAYIQSLGVALGQRPAARWVNRICPRVTGLSREHAALVVDRLRTVAQEAGVRLSAAHCRTNIVISFVGDGPALVRTIFHHALRQFSEVTRDDLPAFLDSPAPMRWWYSTEFTDRDGMPSADAGPAGLVNNAEGGGNGIESREGGFISRPGASLVSTQVKRTLHSATVVVDVNRAQGVTLDALSAYIAMISLAEIRPAADGQAGSILGLFAERSVRDLSARDRAFLYALYHIPLDREARAHRGLLRAGLLHPIPVGDDGVAGH